MSDAATETSTIVWFELPAEDTRRAQVFYRQLFNWGFRRHEGWDYHLTDEGGGAIVGGTGQKGLMAYFGVSDIDGSVARVRDLGGQAGDRQEIPGVGLYSHCTDTEGNSFGLYQGLPQ